jgi:hypothetical protein
MPVLKFITLIFSFQDVNELIASGLEKLGNVPAVGSGAAVTAGAVPEAAVAQAAPLPEEKVRLCCVYLAALRAAVIAGAVPFSVGKNPGFFKKTQPSGFFWVFLGFFAQTNTFRCIQTLNYNHSY